MMECSMLGTNYRQLAALAAYRAVTREPDKFGDVSDRDEHARTEEQYRDALASIIASTDRENMDLQWVNAEQGLARVLLTWNREGVPGAIYGSENGAHRLVLHVAAGG
jgi:hypothetical protein